jgi:ankyrin repeat protein
LRQALSSLPRSLDDTYRRILERIEEQEQGHVRRILQWLCFSKRPLRLEEIVAVYEIADKIQPPFAHEDSLFHFEDIIGICRGLLSLSFQSKYNEWPMWRHFPPNQPLGIVQLAHFSVKEYLTSSLSAPWTIDEPLSHVAVLKCAIAYYLHFMTLHDIQLLPDYELVWKYSLAQYFVKYLPGHLTPVGEHSDLLTSLRLLLHPPSAPIATRLGGLLLGKSGSQQWINPIDGEVARNPATNLYLAMHLRLPQVCQSLLAMNICLNLARPLYNCRKPAVGSPLIEAVRYGDREILQTLLDARAKHHYDGLDPLADGSVLEEAVRKKDIQAVQSLLMAACDIEETVVRFGRSLPLAVVNSHKDLVVTLLAAGADPNARGDDDTAALLSASSVGNEEIVKILVGAGANVNISNGGAIYSASAGGHEGVVRVLTEAGADVSLKGNGETALEAASRRGDAKIVKLLLDAGADVGMALCSASSGGYEEVVCMLIEAGADANVKFGGGRALDRASRLGHTKIVKMLLDAGVDVDAGDGWALYSASSEGHEGVVRILIEAGAAVNPKFLGQTALDRASRFGYPKIVKILLDAGADVNRKDGWGLYFASSQGFEEVVRLLIGAGADVNMKCNGETAIEVASNHGHATVVKLLLDAGADEAGCGRALYLASSRGDEEVIRILSEAGAAVKLKLFEQAALSRASHYSHAEVVQMLLDAGATFGNPSQTQDYSHPSCVVDEDDNKDDYDTDSEYSKAEEVEGEVEDDERQETEVEANDDLRQETEAEEDFESEEEDRRRKRKRKNLKSDQTTKKQRKAGSASRSSSCDRERIEEDEGDS